MNTLALAEFFGGCLALLTAIGQFSVRNRTEANYYFGGIYLCIAAILFASYNILPNFDYVYPALAYADLPFVYSLGPLIYLLIKVTQGKKPIGGRWVHFLPAIAALVLMIPFYQIAPDEKSDRLYNVFIEAEWAYYDYYFGLGMIITIGYAVYGLKDAAGAMTLEILRTDRSVQLISFILLITLFALICAFCGLLIREMIWVKVGTVIGTFGLCLKFVIGQRYPEFNENMQFLVRQASYKHSYIKDLDLGSLEGKLAQVVGKNKVYRDANLSLSTLARELDISIHQLSQFLNEHMGKNFAGFINDFRLTEAKELLIKNPELTINDISHRVGFRSQSSFHRVFVRSTGLPPSKFRSQGRAG